MRRALCSSATSGLRFSSCPKGERGVRCTHPVLVDDVDDHHELPVHGPVVHHAHPAHLHVSPERLKGAKGEGKCSRKGHWCSREPESQPWK